MVAAGRARLILIALASLAGCAGGSGHSHRSRGGPTTCAATLDRVEQLAGDMDRGFAAGPISGFERLDSRRLWREACAHFSPWVRRCMVLSNVRQELSSCEPANEPWARRYDMTGPSPEEKAAFLACVEGSNDRRALARCQYDP
jgi:hypothetical protein